MTEPHDSHRITAADYDVQGVLLATNIWPPAAFVLFVSPQPASPPRADTDLLPLSGRHRTVTPFRYLMYTSPT
jgi:hypothetical protein